MLPRQPWIRQIARIQPQPADDWLRLYQSFRSAVCTMDVRFCGVLLCEPRAIVPIFLDFQDIPPVVATNRSCQAVHAPSTEFAAEFPNLTADRSGGQVVVVPHIP
jgi:hypothetical protein